LIRSYRVTPDTVAGASHNHEIMLDYAEDRASATALDKSAIYALLRLREPGDMIWSMFRQGSGYGQTDADADLDARIELLAAMLARARNLTEAKLVDARVL